MIVEVRLYATLRRCSPESPSGVLSVEVPIGYSVAELLGKMNIAAGEVHSVMINGVISTLESALHDGDRVGLFPAVGGG